MKSDKTTIQQRVEEVLLIRLRGAEFVDILQHAAENQWGVKERQLREYIAKADDLLEQTLEKDRQKLMNRHLAQRRTLFAAAFAAADFSTARAVLKDEAELLGLYPAAKKEITGANGGPLQIESRVLTHDERRNALMAILETSSPGPGNPREDEPSRGETLDRAGAGDDPQRDDAGPVADAITTLFK